MNSNTPSLWDQRPPTKPDPYQKLEATATTCGKSVAHSILSRVRDFPKRERLLQRYADGTLGSVPGQILWHGLAEEAAPVFVVYKLIHEALSNAPSFFRRTITEVMRAQPDRFSRVFSRETLWSLLTNAPGFSAPTGLRDRERLQRLLASLNKKGLWSRSEAEIASEVEYILSVLDSDEKVETGFEALRSLQTERAQGLTAGNVMLFVPAKLKQFAQEVCELGQRTKLPKLEDVWAKVAEIQRDNSTEGRHQGIPIDIMFTDLEEDQLNAFILVRSSAALSARREARVHSIYIRYFLALAFKAYTHAQIQVRLAFYLDPEGGFRKTEKREALFHESEMTSYHDFWQIITGLGDGDRLLNKVLETAVGSLREANLVQILKTHFNRASGRKQVDRP
jgi:hypothetical protein